MFLIKKKKKKIFNGKKNYSKMTQAYAEGCMDTFISV